MSIPNRDDSGTSRQPAKDAAYRMMKLESVQLITPSEAGSGLSRYTSRLTQGLKGLGIDLMPCFVPEHPSPVPSPSGLRRIRSLYRSLLSTYPIQVKLDRAQIYHLTVQTFAMLLLFRRFSSPVVVTVHDIAPFLLRRDRELNMFPHTIDALIYRLGLAGLRRADRVIVCSEYTRRTLLEALKLTPEMINTIHHGIDHTLFRPSPVPDDFYSRYGLDKSSRYILYVGSEQPRKNFLTLLRTFAVLRRSIGDVRLLKVGRPGDERQRQRALKLIGELGIEKDVLFFGHVPEDDLPYFYNAAQIFVFPSRFEGFGFPPLEAMACGTPVICSNATSLPEVVGNAAVLFDPGVEDELVEAMELLLSDGNARHDYALRGIENAGLFEWGLTVQKTLDVYHDTLNKLEDRPKP